jgi:hypothetical protein
MNHSAIKLFAMTMTAAALAVSAAHASTSQWLGENVPFDAAADEPQPVVFVSGSLGMTSAPTLADASKWLGENVPFDPAVAEEPSTVAFEHNYPTSNIEVAGLLLDLPADSFSEVTFPPMSDYSVDDAPIMMASLDPLDTP